MHNLHMYLSLKRMMKVIQGSSSMHNYVGGLGELRFQQSQVVFCLDIVLQFDTGNKNFGGIKSIREKSSNVVDKKNYL